jgi:hypothetical protein
MQTTLRLDEQLLGAARREALARGQSLNSFIAGALRQEINPARRRAKPRSVRLVTFRGHGLQSGVNLDDSRALLDRLDGRS